MEIQYHYTERTLCPRYEASSKDGSGVGTVQSPLYVTRGYFVITYIKF